MPICGNNLNHTIWGIGEVNAPFLPQQEKSRKKKAVSASQRVASRHVFGSLCGSPLREAALFADSTGQQIAFPVGRQLAVRHVSRLN